VWHACHDDRVADTIWSIVAALGALVVVGVIFYYWIARDHDREREQAARRYFDEHGHWPDEAPAWPDEAPAWPDEAPRA
jgi:hypothetical protein